MSRTHEFTRPRDATSENQRHRCRREHCQGCGFRYRRSRIHGREAAELALPCEEFGAFSIEVAIGVALRVRGVPGCAKAGLPARQIDAVDDSVAVEVGRQTGRHGHLAGGELRGVPREAFESR